MTRYSYILVVLALIFAFGKTEVSAQDPEPSPTPYNVDRKGDPAEAVEGVPVIAPDYLSDERQLPDLGRVGVDMMQQRSLTLSEAIEAALENNRDIEVWRKAIRSAEFDLAATRGFYQPRLAGQVYYNRNTVPNVSIFSTNQKTTQGTLLGNATINAYAPKYGTVFAATFANQRLTTDNPISILSPQLNANLGFSVTQPLFRGRAIDQNRRTIEIARRNIELTDTQFRQRAIETVAQVQRAYWDLTFALRNLQVQRDSVRDAKQQLAHNRRLVEEGQLAPIDIVAAETQVANFELAVYDALNVVNITENTLKNLISPNRNDRVWGVSLTPVDSVELTIPTTTLTEALELALNNRPELDVNQAQRDINEIDQRFYKDQTKPQVDLNASYSSAGVGGSLNPGFSAPFPLPCTIAPTSPECQQQTANLSVLTGNPYRGVVTNRYPDYRVGVTFNIPLFGDKGAQAQLGKARVDAERIEVQREQIEQGIQIEVRNALQAIRTGEARLRSAAIARENTARQYESEQRKLDAGQSDTYKVLERQTALAAARSNELRARIELNKAIAELQRVTGNSLRANNIEPRK
jgi:outer membrane protein